jgi:hypothetical protein
LPEHSTTLFPAQGVQWRDRATMQPTASSAPSINGILARERKCIKVLRSRRNLADVPPGRRAVAGEAGNLVGLALSGGGIRSATFGLGVLDGLRRLGLLRQIDYLSTVSGGGYIGAWLVAGCKNEPGWMDPPDSNNPNRPNKPDPWTKSIDHLRDYSNYLSPASGLASWELFSAWLRNGLMVFALVVVTLAAIALVPFWVVKILEWISRGSMTLLLLVWALTLAPLAGYWLHLLALSVKSTSFESITSS